MNRLANMISELCPDGVEYKTIGEIATDIFRGSGIKRDDITEYGIPCVRYGEIYTTYDIWFDKCISHVQLNKVQSPKYFEYGDILFAITGESIEEIAKSVAYVGHDKCLAGGDIVVIKHNQDPKYLSYALSTTNAQKQKSAGKVKSKVVHASVPSISGIVVPIPPLQIQREIARILDSFTELVTKITAELTAEFAARKKQYQYYSKLQFEMIKDNYPTKPISAFGKWSGGKTPSMAEKNYWVNGTIPWISSKDMKSSVLCDTEDHITEYAIIDASMTLYPKECIAIVTRSGILKHTFPISFIPFATTVNQDIKILVPNSNVIPKYIFLAMKAYAEDIRIRAKKQGGTVDSLEFQKVLEFALPFPPIEEQHHIATILDRFDTICNDISNGLSDEITTRQKQYEYYRDKLLTFKPLS